MRTVYSGSGADTTSAVQSYLAANNTLLLRNLYIIGQPESPYSLYLTDHEAPIASTLYSSKTFQPSTIQRGDIVCKIGLDASNMDLSWSPGPATYSANVASADPRVLAQNGWFDAWPVLVIAGLMPLASPGDVNTLGTVKLFKGYISKATVDRQVLKFQVESPLVFLDQQVPGNLIEATNSLANYTAAAPPAGESNIPAFTTFTGSTDTVVYGDVLSPYGAHHIFATNAFQGGWLIFIPGTGSTLTAMWSVIVGNSDYTDVYSVHHNQFNLASPLPFPPTPWSGSSGDQFIVSAPVPTVGQGYPFQYVPAPETAV